MACASSARRSRRTLPGDVISSLGAFVGQRPGMTVIIDGNKGKDALGDLLRGLAAATAACPGLNLYDHRRVASRLQRAIATYLVADRDRAQKPHCLDGD